MASRIWMVVLAVIALGASEAPAQVIFIEPCGVQIPPFAPTTLDVWVCMEGAIAGGITAAEFRIAGLPATWVPTITPDASASSVVGDLFGNGVRITFPTCQTGWGQYLHLFAVQILATDVQNDIELMVAKTIPLTDPNFDCSFVTLCDDPVFTKVCVGNHGAIVNPFKRNCGLPVVANSWTGVKQMFE